MKARPISPYRMEIRELEERLEGLRVLDKQWRDERAAQIRAERERGRPVAAIARRFSLSAGYTRVLLAELRP